MNDQNGSMFLLLTVDLVLLSYFSILRYALKYLKSSITDVSLIRNLNGYEMIRDFDFNLRIFATVYISFAVTLVNRCLFGFTMPKIFAFFFAFFVTILIEIVTIFSVHFIFRSFLQRGNFSVKIVKQSAKSLFVSFSLIPHFSLGNIFSIN